MNKAPNLFEIASSELSQDAFITWLIQWADPMYKLYDPERQNAGEKFLRSLISKNTQYGSDNYNITKVRAGRQRNNIDIWVEVNDDIFIAIEDKTRTKDHSGQLKKYMLQAENYRNEGGDRWTTIIPIYLKTGNESHCTLFDKGEYFTYTRKNFIEALPSNSSISIIIDFKSNLLRIEAITDFYRSIPTSEPWPWLAKQGFYIQLQVQLLELASDRVDHGWSTWDYVSNSNGGFIGMFWAWNWYPPANCSLYLQIEDCKQLYIRVEYGLKDDNGQPISVDTNEKYQILQQLQQRISCSPEFGNISIQKPSRFRPGKTGAIVLVTQKNQNDFLSVNDRGFVDTIDTFNFLLQVESLVKSIC